MKRAFLTWIAVLVALSGVALAQNPCDDAYIKAMQAKTPAEQAKLLKDYLDQCAGKGSQYENFAHGYLFLAWLKTSKVDAATLAEGEKAVTFSGFDEGLKCQMLTQLSALYVNSGQNLDKAKAHASQLIQVATAAKAKDAENATWTTFIGAGHFLTGQALEKAKDNAKAIESYITAYGILKDAKILLEMKRIAKAQYDAKNYAEAEKTYRALVQANPRDTESQTLIPQCLYKQGKTSEALALWKDAFIKSKSADLAYNIGITLYNESKANPALANDALRFLIDAAVLSAKYQNAIGMATKIYLSQNKEYNDLGRQKDESNRLIDAWAKQINTKFGDKSEDDLTSDERREYRKTKELIDKEQKTLEALVTKEKAIVEGFEKIVAEEKAKLGK
jgi:tetratricopeptide (TPR) repeat protein